MGTLAFGCSSFLFFEITNTARDMSTGISARHFEVISTDNYFVLLFSSFVNMNPAIAPHLFSYECTDSTLCTLLFLTTCWA